MYKRVIILQEVDNSYAMRGTKVCGMVRIAGAEKMATVTTFVTNVDSASYGSWWVVVCCGGNRYSYKLDTFNNCQCSMPIGQYRDVACAIVKLDTEVHVVAEGTIGNGKLDGITTDTVKESIDGTPYEQMLAVTDNFYDQGIQAMHSSVSDKYRLIDNYSTAFERYYASGQTDSYYDNVKGEILRLFVQFPPHYPLMQLYPDSFFVRIDFRDTDQYFAMGVIQIGGVVRYICYALPANSSEYQDKDFSYIESSGAGYYILYQDAINGQITTILS